MGEVSETVWKMLRLRGNVIGRILTRSKHEPKPRIGTRPAISKVEQAMKVGTKDCRHGKLTYLQNDAYIGKSLDIYGEYSEGEIDLFRQLLRPGDIAVDVGANIGALTVGMARLVAPGGAVVAFEPQGAIVDILRNNLRSNGLANVTAHRRAVGSQPGAIRVPPLDYAQTENFGGVALGGSQGDEVEVVTRQPRTSAAASAQGRRRGHGVRGRHGSAGDDRAFAARALYRKRPSRSFATSHFAAFRYWLSSVVAHHATVQSQEFLPLPR